MPVLEILQLQVPPHISPTDPSILQSIITVRTALRTRVHNTQSRIYQSLSNPRTIYIFGLWPSLATHHAFLSSPLREEILAPQDGLTEFKWMIHVPIKDGQFEEIPFKAPVLAIARLWIKGPDDGEDVNEFERKVESNMWVIKEATAPWKVVGGWRCDGPGERKKGESVALTGWESEEAHNRFRERVRGENEEYRSMREHYEGMEVDHARNMEEV